jgi:hypothetical protein
MEIYLWLRIYRSFDSSTDLEVIDIDLVINIKTLQPTSISALRNSVPAISKWRSQVAVAREQHCTHAMCDPEVCYDETGLYLKNADFVKVPIFLDELQ